MINLCPFCGSWIKPRLLDGITTCSDCDRIFDCSEKNRFLAAAWACKKQHFVEEDSVCQIYELSDQYKPLLKAYIKIA